MSDTICQCGHPAESHDEELQEGDTGNGHRCNVAGCPCMGWRSKSPQRTLDPELAARVTAAKAALGDYKRERDEWVSEQVTQPPDFISWAERFSAELRGLVGHIEKSQR